MKKSIADKWVRALRSGVYKQGAPVFLKDKNSNYCCLGVLCEITPGGLDKNRDPNHELPLVGVGGLSSNTGSLGDLVSLASLNDGTRDYYSLKYLSSTAGRFTFDEIADIIQICYKEL